LRWKKQGEEWSTVQRREWLAVGEEEEHRTHRGKMGTSSS